MSKDGNNTELDEKWHANKVVNIVSYLSFFCMWGLFTREICDIKLLSCPNLQLAIYDSSALLFKDSISRFGVSEHWLTLWKMGT